jgi:DnaJ-domain-containing protein 1
MDNEQQAILSIALMAALADGQQSDAETASLAAVAKEFGEDLFSEVVTLMGRRTKPKMNFSTNFARLSSYPVTRVNCS